MFRKLSPYQAALAACLMLAGSSIPGNTQAADRADPADAGLLSEADLIARVIAANPGLAALRAAAEAAHHRIGPAGSLDDPTLRYAAAPRTIGSSRFNYVAEFSQRIPWPGTLKSREHAARHQAEAAAAEEDQLRLVVTARARAALAEWRFLGEALTINKATRCLLGDLISTARSRYAAGRAPRQHVLQAEIEQARVDNETLRLAKERTRVLAELNALLNRAPATPLPDAAPLESLQEPPPEETLENLALAQHPLLSRLNARVAAEHSEVTLAEKAFYPDFQVGVGYNGLWDEPDKRPVLGVTINVPLNRAKRRAELSGARAQLLQTRWQLEEQRSELLANIARARAAVTEARESAALHETKLVPLASEYLNNALSDYRSGQGAFLNVIDAEQRKLDAELALARTHALYAQRMAELERFVGRPLTMPRSNANGARQ